MSYLPPQENPAGTYYQDGLVLAISRLQLDEPEAAITGIWISILTDKFPGLAGYFIRPQQTANGGFSDLFMVHLNMDATPVREYHFCIVQCKRLSAEGQASVWNEARSQLRRYLPNLKPKNRAHPVYGAVAVGRWVEFYWYNGDAVAGQDPLELFRSTDKLHIARQCRTINGILDDIKADHI